MGQGGDLARGPVMARKGKDIAAPARREGGVTLREVKQHDSADDCWLVIKGSVYDVTGWKHPGGKVIHSHAGRDATDAFAAWHNADAWAMLERFKVGPLAQEAQDDADTPLLRDFRALRVQARRQGLFKSNKLFYAWKVASTLALCVGAAAVALQGGRALSWAAYLASAALMGLFFQQSGWLAHDFLHNQVFDSSLLNECVGYMVGNVWQGFSVAWWKNKHNYHHAACNEIGDDGDAVDPDIDTIPLLAWDERMLGQLDPASSLQRFIIRNQAALFFPLLSFAKFTWNYSSMMDVHLAGSTRSAAALAVEVAGLTAHYVWTAALAIKAFGPTMAALGYFALSNIAGGLLVAFVFVQSHNGKEVHAFAEKGKDWLRMQVETTRNQPGSLLNNWFSGGLNMQIEHHLFPTMPRHSLPKMVAMVKQLCAKHGIVYEECGWIESTRRVLAHLSAISLKLE